jgi:iron complex transport system substrate-binding protein
VLLIDRVGQRRSRVTTPRGLLIAALISLLSIVAMRHQAGANILNGGVAHYDPNVDYFPAKVRVQHATGFTVRYYPHYKAVTVRNPWRRTKQMFQYVLVQRGAPAPEGYPKAQRIEVPVRTMVTMSTTYLPYLDRLGIADRLVGHSALKQVNTPAIVKRIQAGQLVEVGSGAGVNVELLLDVNPDLIMTHAVETPQHNAHPKLLEAGLKVALNAAYMDTSPLGRTEWMKFVALFFNREATAERLFHDIVAAYERLTNLTRHVQIKPIVFAQAEYQGTWFMPGGNSYQARFLKDAGATYLWADDDSSGSLRLDFEAVFERASKADFWLVNTSGWERLQDVLAADERYANFAALQQGRVYNNNARLNAHGGNDYWETGVANPHLVLADLIKIFHPELVPDHELIWYRPLKRE